MLTLTQVAESVDVDDVDLHELVSCASCGTVQAPDGTCLEVGACARADAIATRGAVGESSKFRAWTASGRVD